MHNQAYEYLPLSLKMLVRRVLHAYDPYIQCKDFKGASQYEIVDTENSFIIQLAGI